MDPSPRSTSSPAAAAAAAADPAKAFASRGCCCFWITRSSVTWERIRTGDDKTRPEYDSGGRTRKWWRATVGALMKAREWSEIVAGPKWKTFIRRINRSTRHGGGGGRRFGYDPLSYALNFDGGNNGGSPERDFAYPDFSTRFVAPPASSKSSMDLGGSDAPVLFAPPPPVVAAAVH